MSVREVVVIGAGPSGFTAAIYMGRALLSPLVLAGEKKGGQLMYTTEVENFPGFDNGVMGPDLMMKMEEQAKRFGAEIRQVNVTKVDFSEKVKKVWVGDEMIETKAVVISTGAGARMLGIGEERLLGRGVSTCAVCDAAFFKNKITTVVGGGDAAMEDAMALAKFAQEVYLIHRRDEFRASKVMVERVMANSKIKIVFDSEVTEVAGEKMVEKIKVKNVKTGEEKEMVMNGLFLAVGHLPVTEMFKGQVELDDKGFLLTRQTGIMSGKWKANKDEWLEGYPTMTSADGVFACGDVVDYRYKQAITAAGMGCQASLDVEKYLTGKTSNY